MEESPSSVESGNLIVGVMRIASIVNCKLPSPDDMEFFNNIGKYRTLVRGINSSLLTLINDLSDVCKEPMMERLKLDFDEDFEDHMDKYQDLVDISDPLLEKAV